MNRNSQSDQHDTSAPELSAPSCAGGAGKKAPSERSPARRLRFGVFEFDPNACELRRNARRVHLQEMPSRVLQMLLEHPNELVTRETFFARLWPDDESGILDDNLNTAVRKLRLALTDSAHHPRYIETVPKRGYRFVGHIEHDQAPVADATTVEAHRQQLQPSHPAQHIGWKVVAPILIALLAIGTLFVIQQEKSAGTATVSTASDSNTLAVLPFVNASGNLDNEYFSDGLTEELTDRLSRSGGLRVVSQTSTFAIKGKKLGTQEIGRLLGAQSLVEGSVRRSGDHLRIHVRLINAADGYQLWSEIFDRRMDDVFEVQEEIALFITNVLTGRVLNAQGVNASVEAREDSIADPLAYDSYLKGRFYWHRRTNEGLRAAAEHFEQAVARAPNYARAWAGLADAYAVLGFYDYLAPAEAFPKAQTAARRALAIDANNASAEATLGYAALYYEWNLVEAEARFRKSIALDPSYSKSHQWYGNLLTAAGRFDEAEREMRRAQQLEPLSLIASAALGWVLYHANRPEEALEQYRLTLALDPDFELAYLWSGWALESQGKYAEAGAMVKEAVARSGSNGISVASLARIQAMSGEREEALRTLQQLLSSKGYVPSYEIAKAWLALGDTERADEWLQKAYQQRSHSLVFLRVDPQLANHRSEAPFLSVAARVAAISH